MPGSRMDFRGTSITRLAARFENFRSLITVGDMVFAMERQRARILSRTARGFDFNEQPFREYNKTRPVYLYPEGSQGGRITGIGTAAAKKSSDRTFRKLKRSGESRASRTKKGIRFSSYFAMKRAFGVNTVNLRSIRTPDRHMLDNLVVKVDGTTIRGTGARRFSRDRPGRVVSLTVEGREESRRMRIHGTGRDNQPKRKAMGMSASDKSKFLFDVTRGVSGKLAGRGEV